MSENHRKTRLFVGVINHYPDDDDWHNVHLDISNRGLWDAELGTFVAPEFVADISDELPMFQDESLDEVVAHHVLEHLPEGKGRIAVQAIYRVLKPGAIFDVEVPDMDRICEAWVKRRHTAADLQQWIYGEELNHHEPGDSHRYAYTARTLKMLLEDIGFKIVEQPETGLAVRYRARKPGEAT